MKKKGHIHPGRLTWNLRIHRWKRKIIFQTIIFRFYVNLPGCNWVGFHPRKNYPFNNHHGSPPFFKWPKFGLTAPRYYVQTQAFRVFFEAYTSGTWKTQIDGCFNHLARGCWSYCWWFRNPAITSWYGESTIIYSYYITSWYGKFTIMYRAVFDISGGDGGISEPSTVWHGSIYFPYGSGKGIFCEHWSDLYSYHRPLTRRARFLDGPAGWSHHLLDCHVMFSTHCPLSGSHVQYGDHQKPKNEAYCKKRCPPWN